MIRHYPIASKNGQNGQLRTREARARRSIPSLDRSALESSSAPPGQRVVSLDAMRGLTMFWIVGGAGWVVALAACLHPTLAEFLDAQTSHAAWQGFHLWDMIMPTFLFVVGAAIPFAMAKRAEEGRSAYWRIARRVAALWLLGMVAQGSLLSWRWEKLELFSNTLQAIAIGYLVTALAMLHMQLRGRIALCGALVAAYWALVTWVPFAGHAAGTLEPDANLPLFVDQVLLGHFRRNHDFTWILSSLGFSATVLLGSFAGDLLRARLAPARKLAVMTALGLALSVAGWVWSGWHPLNRHVWTSSLVLFCGGVNWLALALLYGVIDVAGIRRWSFPFVVLGANALLAYVYFQVYRRVFSDRLVTALAEQLPPPYDDVLRTTAGLALLWLALWFLYRQRSFLRV